MKRESLLKTLLAAGLACAGLFLLFHARGKPTAVQPVATAPARLTASPREIPPASTPIDSWKTNWDKLAGQLTSPEQEREMCSALEELAAQNSEQAISIALSIKDTALRDTLLQAVLRGWASHDLQGAANWAQTQPYLYRELAIAAIFNGGAKDASAAIALAQKFSSEDPVNAPDYGKYLIHGLGEAGRHQDAVNFAITGEGESGMQWIISAYSDWGRKEQKAAIDAANAIGDTAKYQLAWSSAVNGWAQTHPDNLADMAVAFPEGTQRQLALTAALRQWIDKDPSAAADWITRHKFVPEMESALED